LQHKGQIVAISSVAGEISPPYVSLYSAAKHAMMGFFESLQNEESGVDITIVLPGYVDTGLDDKKVVGDGSVQAVELNINASKYMSVQKAADMILDAAAKKKTKYHLTTSGSLGNAMLALMPGLLNSAVRSEMKSITKSS
jgi:short-subunit dehydrogenase